MKWYLLFIGLIFLLMPFAHAHSDSQKEKAAADHIKRIKLLSKKNNPESQLDLGWHYEKGQGISQDYAKAAYWYGKAAHGNSRKSATVAAQYKLGILYYMGIGVEQHYIKAREWQSRAAARGLHQGQYELGRFYYTGKGGVQNYGLAERWWLRAAAQGSADAMYGLYTCHAKGGGSIRKDPAKAREWKIKAAKHGHIDAQYQLGIMYENGDEIEQNYVTAYAWMDIAADRGNETAEKHRDLITEKLNDDLLGEANILSREYFKFYVEPFRNMSEPFQNMSALFREEHLITND